MPKDKKKERRPSTSDSDSGPEDKGPAKKAKPTAAGSTSHCSMENGEPTWNLGGGMKFVKVRLQCDIQKKYLLQTRRAV